MAVFALFFSIVCFAVVISSALEKTKPCRACKHKVSKQAAVCPSCGQPNP